MAAEIQKQAVRKVRLTLKSFSEDDTLQIGELIASVLRPGMIVALFGPLGSGKTVLVKGICRGLGVPPDDVSSPSFTILNIYSGRLPVFHFDFYRLQPETNWAELGIDEYFYDEGVVLIEWPDRLGEELPEEAAQIFIQRILPVKPETENQRLLVIHGLPLPEGELSRFVAEEAG